jgi:hypothetical protein
VDVREDAVPVVCSGSDTLRASSIQPGVRTDLSGGRGIKRWIRSLFIYLPISTLAGALIGLLLALGYLRPWKVIETLPAGISVGGETAREFIVGDLSGPMIDFEHPCDRTGPSFSWLTNRPLFIADCVLVERSWADARLSQVYAIDARGRLWHWRWDAGHMDVFMIPMLAAGGLVLGLVVSIAVPVIRRRRRRGL